MESESESNNDPKIKKSKSNSKNSLYTILNKDSVWNKIKKYIYLITFFLFIILILIVCIFILSVFILFKVQIKNQSIPQFNLGQ
jgi:hypothetical protein